MIVSMTASASAAATRRLILVPAAPRADRGDATLRRFRLARLRLEGRDIARSERFDHCKRCYD
jgi:hypothetical protein